MNSFFAAALGAFFAAWLGATLAFRRTRKERALDHTVSWHQSTILSLSRYETCLELLHRESRHALVVMREGTDTGELPKTFQPSEDIWAKLRDAEIECRENLRSADVFTKGRAMLESSVALNTSVNLYSISWFDLSARPPIPWRDLQVRMSSVARVRRYLQESLRIELELQGLLGTLLGVRYRRWRVLRELEKLRLELGVDDGTGSESDS